MKNQRWVGNTYTRPSVRSSAFRNHNFWFKPGWSLFHSLRSVSGYTSSDPGLICSLVGRIPDNTLYQSVGGRSEQTAV